MLVFFCLDRERGEALLKSQNNVIPEHNEEAVTTYLYKNDAIKALKKNMRHIIKSDKSNQHLFMLFEYYVENENIRFDIPEGSDTVDKMSKMFCPNDFPMENLLTVESLYFYCDNNNRIKYKRCSKYIDPEILEELRKENDEGRSVFIVVKL